MVMLVTPVKVPTVIFDLHTNLEMRSSSKVITKKPRVYDNSPVIRLTMIPTRTTSTQAIMLYQTYEIR